jgi:hypothetical protein
VVKIAVTDGEAFLDACAALAMLSSPASDPPVARHYSLKKLESSVVAHCLTSQAAKVEGGGVGADRMRSGRKMFRISDLLPVLCDR